MSTHAEVTAQRIQEILGTLKVATIEEACHRLQFWCNERLGINWAMYNIYITHTKVCPDALARKADRTAFRNELFVSRMCKDANMDEATIKDRLKNSLSVPLNENNLCRLRKIFGMPADHQAIMMSRRKPEEVEYEKKVIAMWQAGKTLREIAEAVGRTEGSVFQKMNRIRRRQPDALPRRQPFGLVRQEGYTPENVCNMLKSGMTHREIADHFGKKISVMSSMISTWRRKHPELNIPYRIAPTETTDVIGTA
jgi:DNA-binding CsgD family transcriptional regulator